MSYEGDVLQIKSNKEKNKAHLHFFISNRNPTEGQRPAITFTVVAFDENYILLKVSFK